MSRYIDTDDVANAIYHHFPSIRTMADARSIIEEAPSIEPKRGEWIEFDTKWGRSLYYCTNCMETSEVPTAFGKPLYNFCPNCGADMREREGE